MATPLTTKTITSECQVVCFKWFHEATRPHTDTQLARATPFDISNYLVSVSYNKQLSSPAGQFQITLPNDRDWKQYIEKGSWLLIYMSQDGGLSIPEVNNKVGLTRSKDGDTPIKDPAKGLFGDFVKLSELANQKAKLRCIGYVDTVRARGSIGSEVGEFDVEYVVSGRDFGVVYEETELWHNQVLFDKLLLETVNAKINHKDIATVDGLLTQLHHLFLAPEKIVKNPLKTGSLTSLAKQWLLPSALWRALGLKGASNPFFGNIPNLLNFKPTKATYPVANPTALLHGNMWSRLKAFSIEPYHELFPELNDQGLPRLNFRVIPWRVTNKSSKFAGIFPTMDKFASPKNGLIEIPNIDILNWDLGEDNHTRYNLFWSTINSSTVSIQTSNALLGNNDPITGFPRLLQESIKRHGLRMLYSEVDANVTLGSEEANGDLIRQFNELCVEFWGRSHDYESGTISIIGNNEIRIGKAIHIEKNSQYNSDKFFYIEGYEDQWSVDDGATMWEQSLFVTRGIEAQALKNPKLVKERQSKFEDSGDFTKKTSTGK